MILDPAKDFLKLFRKILEKISLESKLLINELGISFKKNVHQFQLTLLSSTKKFFESILLEKECLRFIFTQLLSIFETILGGVISKRICIFEALFSFVVETQ